MVRTHSGLVLTLCLVGLMAAVPGGAGDDQACAPSGVSAVHGSDLVQDDAGSGGDAGDLATVALDLPREGVANGSLDYPADESPLLDLSDWFTLHLAGAGETLMVNISVLYTIEVVPPFGQVRVDIYPPEADEPVASADSARQDTAEVSDNHVAGAWRFHVLYMESNGTERCGTSSDVDAPIALPPEVTDALGGYHVYVGCHPVCMETNG